MNKTCSSIFIALLTSVLFISSANSDQSTSIQTNSDQISSAPPNSKIYWHAWTPDIFEQAKKENRLLLVDVSAVWCAFCKKMDAITYQNPDVLKEIQDHYLPVRVKEGAPLTPGVEQFSEYTRPTTAIFNTEGVELIAKKGYLKPQWMTWMLQAVALNPVVESNAKSN